MKSLENLGILLTSGRMQVIINGGHVLQRKLKETIILNKYDLKWKETSENCRWEHRTR